MAIARGLNILYSQIFMMAVHLPIIHGYVPCTIQGLFHGMVLYLGWLRVQLRHRNIPIRRILLIHRCVDLSLLHHSFLQRRRSDIHYHKCYDKPIGKIKGCVDQIENVPS